MNIQLFIIAWITIGIAASFLKISLWKTAILNDGNIYLKRKINLKLFLITLIWPYQAFSWFIVVNNIGDSPLRSPILPIIPTPSLWSSVEKSNINYYIKTHPNEPTSAISIKYWYVTLILFGPINIVLWVLEILFLFGHLMVYTGIYAYSHRRRWRTI